MRRHLLIVVALALLLAVMAASAIRSTSGTFDETTYLRFSQLLLTDRDSRNLWGFGVAPLPLLLAYALPDLLGIESYRVAVTLARVSALTLFGIPVVVLVYAWLAPRAGRALAAAAGAFIALSPTFLAHASVATTDVASVAASLLALLALERYVDSGTRRAFCLLAVAFAVALATKYSAIALIPIVGITLFISPPPGTKTASGAMARAWRAGVATMILFGLALVGAWAIHGFAIATLDQKHLGASLRVPAPLYGIAYQIRHASLGHEGFLLGERRTTGWWYYTPVALALKSTPAEWVLFGAGMIAFARARRLVSQRQEIWRVAFVVFVALSMLSRVNIGVRYTLILLPLALLATTDWLASLRHRAPRLVAAGCVLLIVAQATSALSARPHYLSYFNAGAGGSEHGYRLLVDSNLDWGQDLPALRDTLAAVGARRPQVAFFGTAPFDAYGVEATLWPGTADERANADWLAISATLLNGLYWKEDPFVRFRAIAPSARAAHSLFLYKLDRPEVQDALREALSRRPPPL